MTKRIAEETAALERLEEKLVDFEGARQRADALVGEREEGYVRVFDAIVAEERVLKELYAPLMKRLKAAGGTLSKLSFSVTRVADVHAWARRGEDLFDLRGGPFKGIGSLEKEANAMLARSLDEWRCRDGLDGDAGFPGTTPRRPARKGTVPASRPGELPALGEALCPMAL